MKYFILSLLLCLTAVAQNSVTTVGIVADLLKQTPSSTKPLITVQGASSINDGLGGTWLWSASSSVATNTLANRGPFAYPYGSTSGRWIEFVTASDTRYQNGYIARTNGFATNLTATVINLVDSNGKESTINGVNIGTGASHVGGSTALGKGALQVASTGTGNTAVGEGAGLSASSGISNTLLGNNAAPFITSSGNNVVVGKDALFSATFGDVTPGTFGYTNGVHNQVVLGVNALYYLTRGRNNFAAGTFSQYNVTNGSFNVSLGTHSMNDLIIGDSNTGLGESTLWKLVSGSNNTAVGKDAGYFSTGSSSGNIYIGNAAGPSSLTTENNRLYISNNGGTPLIGGDFGNSYVQINGQLFQTGNLIVTNGNINSYGTFIFKTPSYTNSPNFYTHQDGGIAMLTGGVGGNYYYHTFGANGVATFNNLASSTDLTVPGGSYLNSITASGVAALNVLTANSLSVSGNTTLSSLTAVNPTFTGQQLQIGNMIVTNGNLTSYGFLFFRSASYTNAPNLYTYQDGGIAMQVGGLAGNYYYHTFGSNGVATFQNLASLTDLTVPGIASLNALNVTGPTTLNTLTAAGNTTLNSLSAVNATFSGVVTNHNYDFYTDINYGINSKSSLGHSRRFYGASTAAAIQAQYGSNPLTDIIFWAFNTNSSTQFPFNSAVPGSGALILGPATQTISGGNGTPEGNISAQIGSIYMQANGGPGANVFFKDSGANTTTGWLPVNPAAGGGGSSPLIIVTPGVTWTGAGTDVAENPIFTTTLPANVLATDWYRMKLEVPFTYINSGTATFTLRVKMGTAPTTYYSDISASIVGAGSTPRPCMLSLIFTRRSSGLIDCMGYTSIGNSTAATTGLGDFGANPNTGSVALTYGFMAQGAGEGFAWSSALNKLDVTVQVSAAGSTIQTSGGHLVKLQ